MADVFISYSRKDAPFVRSLHGVLTEKGRDVWVDWEDIPPSWDWKEELQSGIDSAAALVFVISPDSLSSEVCARELDQALARGKRVIPIVVREPNGNVVPPPLADRNWIFIRSEEEFSPGVEALESALDTDADWVREHTRLLVRANEWERSERRDSSLLLRGSDLSSAESALAGWSHGTEPGPTHVQHEYVAASRAAAVRRTRLLLGGVAVALVVSVVLGVFAILERNRAIDRERAAQSRALAVEALLRADSDPELSVLLGIEAARLGATPEAEEALRRAVSGLQARGVLRVSRKKGVTFTSVKSPSLLLAGAEDGAAKLWDVTAHEAEDASGGTKSLSALVLSPSGDRVLIGSSERAVIVALKSEKRVTLEAPDLRGAGWSDDGKRVVGLQGDHSMTVWDAATGRRIGKPFNDPSATTVTGSLDRHGRRASTTLAGGRVETWDTATGRAFPAHQLPRGNYVDAELSPSGRWEVGVSESSNDGEVWDVASGRRRFVLKGHELPIIAVAVSADGRFIATGSHDNKARVWSAESGRALRVLRGHGDSVTSVAFSRDGRRVLTVSNDETARVWSVETGETLAVTRGHRGEIRSADLSFDGRYVMTGGQDGTARLFEASPGRTLAALSHRGAVEAATLDPPGRIVASSGPDRIQFAEADTGRVLSRDKASILTAGITTDMAIDPRSKWLAVADGAVVQTFNLDNGDYTYYQFDHGAAISVAWTPDGRRIVATSNAGTAVVLDPKTSKTVSPVLRPGGSLIAARFIGSGARAVTLDAEGNARLFDVASGREVDALRSKAAAVAMDVAPDGKTVAIASSDVNARLWRPGAGDKVRRLEHKAYVTNVRFSRDGSRVATASGDGTARVWDVATGKLLQTLRRHTDAVLDVDFTPDGRFLISAGADRQALLWNLGTGRVVSVFGGYDGRVLKARFSRDGKKVLTVPEEGAAAVFACDACGSLDDVIARARKLVGRSLTDAERDRFLD